MTLFDFFRRLASKTEREQHAQCIHLMNLPRDQRRLRTAEYLYDLCVRRAGAFVGDEKKKRDSPFSEATNAVLFHELLAVTFWLMDKNLFNEKGTLLPAVHDQYFRSFHSPDPVEKRSALLAERYGVYRKEWDEISGHQDEFGLAVAQTVFGKEEHIRTRERVFWIVWYADDMMKLFGRMKKIWKAAGFKPAAE